MSQPISQRELRNDSARILRALDEGKSFIVTRHNQPVGELIPLHRARLVERDVVIAAFAGAPAVDAARFFADIDASVDQDIDPRG